MTNQEVAKLLRNVAAAYTIKDEKKYKFQIIAYQRATDTIEHLNLELQDALSGEKPEKIPGIGKTLEQHLKELLAKGHLKHFDDVMQDIPGAVFVLLDIPGFGPKKAYKLTNAFHLNTEGDTIEHLANLAKRGEVAKLEGFGEKSQDEILRLITEYRVGKTKSARMVLPYAFELSKKIISYMKACKEVNEIYPLGSLRRMVSTIGDIDIAAASNNPQKVIEYFTNFPGKERVLEKGETTASLLTDGGKQIDLMVQSPASFGALLQHFTGSKFHNIALREYALKKGWSLSEYGIKAVKDENNTKMFSKEEDFYTSLRLDWIPPEIREDKGEIESARTHSLPNLVTLQNIKGDLHLHSNYPIEPSHDLGVNSFEEIIRKAKSLGYEYIGFSEHNPSMTNHTKEQIHNILRIRMEKIEQIKKSNKNIRVFNMLETDILPSGDLAVDEKGLKYVDAVLVSIHSSFSMNKIEMTKRVLNGLSHPKAKILSHPTGRLLNKRAGFTLNWEKVFDFVVKNKKALEINAWPTRLDLPDDLVKEAKDFGVRFVINTDSHQVDQMDNMFYGVSVARRGWATKNEILNTLVYNEFRTWLLAS